MRVERALDGPLITTGNPAAKTEYQAWSHDEKALQSRSRLQPRSVSLSSAEAEYFGGVMAARDVMFLRDLLLDLGVTVDAPSVIQSDSKSAIDMSLDPVAFKKTKHILRAAEFLRDLVARDVVRMQHLPGKIMVVSWLPTCLQRLSLVHSLRR